jgi:hypothetical protein
VDIALRDIDSLLISALGLLAVEEGRIDAEYHDRKEALETLLEYGRGAVDDGQKGLAGVWHVTSEYLFSEQADSTTNAATTEEA